MGAFNVAPYLHNSLICYQFQYSARDYATIQHIKQYKIACAVVVRLCDFMASYANEVAKTQ